MLLLDRTPAEIWRLLLPKPSILFPAIREYDDLIFQYRNFVYFVHEDGAVVRMNKPQNVRKLAQEDLWELLFHDKDTLDYDDCGFFSIGSILKHMGFLVPMKTGGREGTYEVEILNRMNPDQKGSSYTLTEVTFRFALYHALLQCHELNVREEEGEYEIQSITPLDPGAAEAIPPSSFG